MSVWLRYQFPRDPENATGRRTAEADARACATRFLALPAATRSVGQLESITAPLNVRLSTAIGDQVPGAERLAGWLYLVKAPGRCFLDIDPEAMNSD